jgi:ubiquinone/menaquinone biosynthesis C-methylase UbiE
LITIEDAEGIARQMAVSPQYLDVQVRQTHFRMQLVEGWQIPQGAKVLEIGCGQGDMTAVLADAVGSRGHVAAVDIASPDYGGPVSLGESAEHLKRTALGPRIEFYFQYDVLDPATAFDANAFDYVVLTHCSWYFDSLDQLRRLLRRVRSWASHLCFSEWDKEPHTLNQVAHLLSVLIQGQVEAYKSDSAGNVRTPFSRTRLMQLLSETGWSVSTESVVDSTQLKDADWEIDHCLRSSLREAEALNLPLKFVELLGSQVDTLRLMAGRGKNRSLSSYSIVARRSL